MVPRGFHGESEAEILCGKGIGRNESLGLPGEKEAVRRAGETNVARES